MRFVVLILAAVFAFHQYGCCNAAGTEADAGVRDGGRVRLDGGAGGQDGGPNPDGSVGLGHGPTQGSAIAVTRDGRFAIAVNRRTGRTQGSSIERFSLDIAAGEMTAVGAIPEPDVYQVVIAPDDNTAFAAGTNQIIRYNMIKEGERLQPARNFHFMGGEPRGMAVSPNGTYVFVANWTDGSVYMFNAADLTLVTTIDLNMTIAQSGLLGSVNARAGLSHPYAVAVTDDGDDDDDDETVYVTEFFSQARATGVPPDDSAFDLGRQGVVYVFDVATQTVRMTTIAPRTVPFLDQNGAITGCFPNLLSVAAYHDHRVYIAGTCDSPRGPIGPIFNPATGEVSVPANFKTLIHSAIWVLDSGNDQEAVDEGVVLDVELDRRYTQEGITDDSMRRMPLIVSAIDFIPDTNIAWISAYGADAVFRVEWSSAHAFVRVGSSRNHFIDLAAGDEPGRLPYGLRITGDGKNALIVNEHTRNVSFIDLEQEELIGASDMSVPDPTMTEKSINDGRRDFVTGTGRWSYKGQAWSSCEACHPNGLTDNVTWFFPRGPRQTISLDGSFSSQIPGVQRLFGWTANIDEVHDFELVAREVSGGVGAIVHSVSDPPSEMDRIHFNGRVPVPPGNLATATVENGLNGSAKSMMPGGEASRTSMLADWNDVQEYLQQVKTPRAPSNYDTQLALQGRMVFQSANCGGCHVTEMWTMSRRFYTPNAVNNDILTGVLQMMEYTAPGNLPAVVNPPTAEGNRRAPLRFLDPVDDQINCALRAVGTFPMDPGPNKMGVGPVLVREVRSDMTTLAQGFTGYNIPSLLGIAHTAPYFHAGNARTLEELLSQTFAGHHTAYNGTFTSNDVVSLTQLVHFLLSIDERALQANPPNPAMLGFNPALCPASL